MLDEPFEWSLVYGGALIVAGIALAPAGLRRLPMQPVGPGPLVIVALAAVPAMSCSSGGSAACAKAHTERSIRTSVTSRPVVSRTRPTRRRRPSHPGVAGRRFDSR